MPKSTSKLVGAVIVLAIIVLGIVWFQARETGTVYDSDTTLSGDFGSSLPAGERLVVKDGATITIDGDYSIDGTVDCSDGPVSLIVNGTLTVNGQLRCELDDEFAQNNNEVGNGIMLVVKGDLDFGSDATILTNGNVQITDDVSKLAQTDQEVDELYEDADEDDGDGLRVGPFIDIPLADEQLSLLNPTQDTLMPAAIHNEEKQFSELLSKIFVSPAKAQQPAVDEFGNPVANTVKIGGTWVVGDPTQTPPKGLQIPTPPKGIKKIILAFNFGGNTQMTIKDFTLYGPDGQFGDDDKGSCNVQGGDGKNAFRLNIFAPNITINNFNLFLGYGGDGGFAETNENCDPGVAKGGKGGKPGNFKIIASNKFEIVGAFKISPGQGGRGGQAVAHGKKGAPGCAGEKGGDAISTGGKGGDNKKGLKIFGAVSGVGNIEIEKLVAGYGGGGDSFGGEGGPGNACDCDGGPGGKATANGGKGGDATSRTIPSKGGDGGYANSVPGIGGQGGHCNPQGPGGDGGRGGDAAAKEGKAGTGKTENGSDGEVENEKGGNGGNGGDGCNEGDGGPGGSGNPDGDKGQPGTNICPSNTNTSTGTTVNTNQGAGTTGNTNANTNTNANVNVNTNQNVNTNTSDGVDEVPIEIVELSLISVEPITVNFTYDHANPQCPLKISPIQINAPPEVGWSVTSGQPIWLQLSGERSGNGPGMIPMEFPCLLDQYQNQQQSTQVDILFELPQGPHQKSVQVNGNFTNFEELLP